MYNMVAVYGLTILTAGIVLYVHTSPRGKRKNKISFVQEAAIFTSLAACSSFREEARGEKKRNEDRQIKMKMRKPTLERVCVCARARAGSS